MCGGQPFRASARISSMSKSEPANTLACAQSIPARLASLYRQRYRLSWSSDNASGGSGESGCAVPLLTIRPSDETYGVMPNRSRLSPLEANRLGGVTAEINVVVAAIASPAQNVFNLPVSNAPRLVQFAILVAVHEREQSPDRNIAHIGPQRFTMIANNSKKIPRMANQNRKWMSAITSPPGTGRRATPAPHPTGTRHTRPRGTGTW